MGRIEQAASDFVQAIDRSEDNGWNLAPRKLVARTLARSNDVFDKVAELRPEETSLWIGRGQYRALRSLGREAIDDYAKVIDARPLGDDSFEYAALLLLADDRSRYNEFCQQLVARTGESLEQGRQMFQRAHPTKPAGAALPFAPGEWIEQQLLSREAE